MAEIVQKALQECQLNNNHGRAILDLDVAVFCSQATQPDKTSEAIQTLFEEFIKSDEEAWHQQDKKAERILSKRYLSGLLIHDLLSHQWDRLFKPWAGPEQLEMIIEQLQEVDFEDAKLRNLQALVMAALFKHRVYIDDNQGGLNEILQKLFEPIAEKIQESEYSCVDYSLRTIKYFIDAIDEEADAVQRSRHLHPMVPLLLPGIFQAFTNEEVGVHGRERILDIFYNLIRLITWADGIDNKLVQNCLGETFQSWMALFLQVIQSNPKEYFNVKMHALKSLIVIFRDMINFSRDSINMMLRPAWKLLNQHLPVFTEVVGYNQEIPKDEQEDNEDEQHPDDEELGDDEGGLSGVEGMTYYLLDLLGTLVQRPNVQGLVEQGLVPLTTTVASYLIIQFDKEREFKIDPIYFIADKSQDLMRADSIRSQCLVLLSSLIEVFRDAAIQAILFVCQNIFHSTSPQENQQVNQKQKQAAVVNEEMKEESKEENPNQEAEEHQEDEETLEFKKLLEELVYISKHPKNIWKRREVAILLIGMFVEDISMYMIRHPHFNLLESIFHEILQTKFALAPTKTLQTCLVGRALQSCSSICDLIPKDQEGVFFINKIVDLAVAALLSPDQSASISLIATKCLTKYCRKFNAEELLQNAAKFEQILDPLLLLLDKAPNECLYLPIEAFTTFSKINETTVASMAPKVTPKLLELFRSYHSEGALGTELIGLFKLWCNYEQCHKIFVDTFIPFILEIVEQYYQNTPNVDNKDKVLTMSEKLAQLDLNQEKQPPTESENDKVINVVDATILMHVIDLLTSLLKNTTGPEDKQKICQVFPKIMTYVEKSEDMFLLLNGTKSMKDFINLAAPEILKVTTPERIIEVCKKLLSPTTNEQAAITLGNLVIQVIHKIQPMIDTSLLMCVVWKIYKSRMPSIVQSLVLIFARLIQTNPKEIVEFLSETSVDNRISLKIVLDKWLLQQALFRGTYTRTVTLSSLLKLFTLRDPRLETLMVIGYNPSHSNINSEVNAPFKILSILLRFLENESKPTNKRPLRAPVDIEEEDGGAFGGYQMKRDLLKAEDNMELGMNVGDRMDTMGGDDDYDDEYQYKGDLSDGDKLDVNLDDIEDDEDDDEVIDLSKEPSGGQEEEQIDTQDSSKGDDTNSDPDKSTGSSGPQTSDMFAVGQSNDQGLADMETGSEVYMSELLAGFDMEDFDDAEEANEEDLADLGDHFAKVDCMKHIKESLNSFIITEEQGNQYMYYCAKQLPKEDIELAKKFLTFPKGTPPLP